MKKIFTMTICILLASVLLTGCVSINFFPRLGPGVTGSGTPETFTFNVGEITEIRIELLCNIVYNSTPSDTVTLQVQPNLMEYITVQETAGVLTVRANRNINVTGLNNTPVLTVSTPALTRISHTGAGTITTNDPIYVDELSLNITGAANGNIQMNVRNLSVNITGAGDFTLSGKADTTDINIAGAGKLEALNLETRSSSIIMAGAGTVRISASDELNISAGGVGTVEYKGSPTLNINRGGLVTVRNVN